MATVSIPERLRRHLTFLWGLRDRRARRYLAKYGFDQAELRKGWQLLVTAGGGVLDRDDPIEIEGPAGEALAEVDAWENKWFPIAQASLVANYPAVAGKVFRNLAQTSGIAVLLTVRTLLDRLEALAAADAPEAERAAFALLEKRGLTAAERAVARGLLQRIEGLEIPPVPAEEEEPIPTEAVERAWTWYQEWSAIARSAIPRKDVRIRLGVSTPASTADKDAPKEARPASPASSTPTDTEAAATAPAAAR